MFQRPCRVASQTALCCLQCLLPLKGASWMTIQSSNSYSADPQTAQKFYINGCWSSPAIPASLPVVNPATEEVVAQVAQGSAAENGRDRPCRTYARHDGRGLYRGNGRFSKGITERKTPPLRAPSPHRGEGGMETARHVPSPLGEKVAAAG